MKCWLLASCLMLAGCALIFGDRYSLQTHTFQGGSLVLFNCHVEQYSKSWRQEAESKARFILQQHFSARSDPHDVTAILDINLSEGGWAGVFVVVGEKSFVDYWVDQGRLVAGLKAARRPDVVVKGRLPPEAK